MFPPPEDNPARRYPYLDVDYFLGDILGAQATGLALESGLLDSMSSRYGVRPEELCTQFRVQQRDLQMLLEQLLTSGVVVQEAGGYSLSSRFRRVLPYRDLIEVKLEMANRLAPDLISGFRNFIFDMNAYMGESRLFELFDYSRCHDPDGRNLDVTRTWMRYTSTLSRYEAQPFIDNFDLGSFTSVLDIGGNSGEFAMRLCAASPDLRATVFDLPVVCLIGRGHVADAPFAWHIHFIEGDLRHDALPGGHDLHVFKSFLHDWPEQKLMAYLQKSCSALAPGGTIAIFERSAAAMTGTVAYANLPLYLFRRFYRDPGLYSGMLASAGLTDIRVINILLDSPFMLVSGRKR